MTKRFEHRPDARTAEPPSNHRLSNSTAIHHKRASRFVVLDGISHPPFTTYIILSFIEAQHVRKLEDISINHIAAAFEAFTNRPHFHSAICAFLCFAAEMGWMPTDLSCFVPKVRHHKALPTVYSTDDIEKCLLSIDRTTQSGKRVYAVLLVCARLGLRNTDACELKFSNIDWGKKMISIVQMKTGVPLMLPLLSEDGLCISGTTAFWEFCTAPWETGSCARENLLSTTAF